MMNWNEWKERELKPREWGEHPLVFRNRLEGYLYTFRPHSFEEAVESLKRFGIINNTMSAQEIMDTVAECSAAAEHAPQEVLDEIEAILEVLPPSHSVDEILAKTPAQWEKERAENQRLRGQIWQFGTVVGRYL